MTLTGTIVAAAQATSDAIIDVAHDFVYTQRDLANQQHENAKTQIWLYPPTNNHTLGQSEFSIFFGKRPFEYDLNADEMEAHLDEMETLFQRFNSIFEKNPAIQVLNVIGQQERDVSILGLTGYIASYTVRTSFRVC